MKKLRNSNIHIERMEKPISFRGLITRKNRMKDPLVPSEKASEVIEKGTLDGEVLSHNDPRMRSVIGQIGGRAPKSPKIWKETINRAVMQSDGKKLRQLAEALINQALHGDVAALKEIGDRIDGKSVQQVETKMEGFIYVSAMDKGL